jgi:cell division protease FtsH
MSHSRDYSEEIASAIDEEVRRLIESAHDEAWEILVQYRDVLDNLVLQLMEHETLSRAQVLEIFSPIRQRPTRGSYTGYGKRLPSDRPPVLTPKEMALTAAPDGSDQPGAGNGQALGVGGPEGSNPALGPAGPGGYGPPQGNGSPQGPDDGAPGGSAAGGSAGGPAGGTH